MKILVADDELATQRVLETLLTKHGYEVVLARNGQEALDALERGDAPNLLILDWLMPEIDGIEICRRVRERSRDGYVYIIMVTAKTAKEDFVEGLDAGMDDYLSKPFHPDDCGTRPYDARPARAGRLAVQEACTRRACRRRGHPTSRRRRGFAIRLRWTLQR